MLHENHHDRFVKPTWRRNEMRENRGRAAALQDHALSAPNWQVRALRARTQRAVRESYEKARCEDQGQ